MGVLIRRDQETHTVGRPCEATGDNHVPEPRRGALEETHPAGMLIDFQPAELGENKCLLFEPPAHGTSTAARAGEHICPSSWRQGPLPGLPWGRPLHLVSGALCLLLPLTLKSELATWGM